MCDHIQEFYYNFRHENEGNLSFTIGIFPVITLQEHQLNQSERIRLSRAIDVIGNEEFEILNKDKLFSTSVRILENELALKTAEHDEAFKTVYFNNAEADESFDTTRSDNILLGFRRDSRGKSDDKVYASADQILASARSAILEADKRIEELKDIVKTAMQNEIDTNIAQILKPAEAAIYQLNCSLGVYGEGLTLAREREKSEYAKVTKVRGLTATEEIAYREQLLLWANVIQKLHSEEEKKRLKDLEWDRKLAKATKWDKDYLIANAHIRIEKEFNGDLDSAVTTPTNFISTYSTANCKSLSTTSKHLLPINEIDPHRDYEFDPSRPWDSTPFSNPNRNLTFVPVTLSGIGYNHALKTTMQLDGGASINIISHDLAISLVGEEGINKDGQQCRVQAVGGHVLATTGSVVLEMEMTGRTTAISDRVEMSTAKISTVFLVLKRCSVPILMGSLSMAYYGVNAQPGSGTTTWGNSKWRNRLAIPTIPYSAVRSNSWEPTTKLTVPSHSTKTLLLIN
jgi:hypothetical protein